MLKHIGIAFALATATSAAENANFSISPDKPHQWTGELPSRYLVSFEFKNASRGAKAMVNLDKQTVFEAPSKDDWQAAQIAINPESGSYSSWLGGKELAVDQALANQQAKKVKSPGTSWQSSPVEAKKIYNLGGDFTIAAKFKTKGNGAIISKCAPEGKWTHDSKTLFIRGGRLTYDIGWLGQIQAKPRVSDNKWHHAVLVCAGGRARLYLDG